MSDEQHHDTDDIPIRPLTHPHLSLARRRRVWRPAADLQETDQAFIARVEIAGMEERDFSLTFVHGKLLISGVRMMPEPSATTLQSEITYGEFAVDFFIEQPIRQEHIETHYARGILTITLPKAS